MKPTGKITSQESQHSGFISFADSITWRISGHDTNSAGIVSNLKKAMKLRQSATSPHNQLVVYTKPDSTLKRDLIHPLYSKEHPAGAYFCEVEHPSNMDILALQLMKIASIMRRGAEQNMGFLIHGALAAYNGRGVILAGQGGMGKTTVSERLPYTWQSLCDDTALIVHDKTGGYRAHPWPTWSRFMFGESGGTWDVSRNLPVAGVYFLKRGEQDKITPNNKAESVCRLVKSTEEALKPILLRDDEYDSKDMRINRFDNVCAFAESVPTYILSFTRDGRFWEKIEKVIPGK